MHASSKDFGESVHEPLLLADALSIKMCTDWPKCAFKFAGRIDHVFYLLVVICCLKLIT